MLNFNNKKLQKQQAYFARTYHRLKLLNRKSIQIYQPQNEQIQGTAKQCLLQFSQLDDSRHRNKKYSSFKKQDQIEVTPWLNTPLKIKDENINFQSHKKNMLALATNDNKKIMKKDIQNISPVGKTQKQKRLLTTQKCKRQRGRTNIDDANCNTIQNLQRQQYKGSVNNNPQSRYTSIDKYRCNSDSNQKISYQNQQILKNATKNNNIFNDVNLNVNVNIGQNRYQKNNLFVYQNCKSNTRSSILKQIKQKQNIERQQKQLNNEDITKNIHTSNNQKQFIINQCHSQKVEFTCKKYQKTTQNDESIKMHINNEKLKSQCHSHMISDSTSVLRKQNSSNTKQHIFRRAQFDNILMESQKKINNYNYSYNSSQLKQKILQNLKKQTGYIAPQLTQHINISKSKKMIGRYFKIQDRKTKTKSNVIGYRLKSSLSITKAQNIDSAFQLDGNTLNNPMNKHLFQKYKMIMNRNK